MGSKQKQTRRRLNRRMRLNAARLEAARPTVMPRPAAVSASSSLGCRGWLSVLVAVAFLLALSTWMLWDQVQIGRVLLSGVPADGTVVAVNQCSRATAGDVTITFTDARGEGHRVRHSSFTLGCFTAYHVGDTVAVRYIPGDPAALMTQPEIADLWFSLLLFGLYDILFLGGGVVAFFLVVLPKASEKMSVLRVQRRV
jgi:transposase InsO family protein